MERKAIKFNIVKSEDKDLPSIDELLPIVVENITNGRVNKSYDTCLGNNNSFHCVNSYIHQISEAIKLKLNCRTTISHDNIEFSRLSGGDDMLINYVECHIELLYIDEKDYSLLSSYRNYCRRMQIY